MLNRRQIEVQQNNLASMCRIAVKSLLDYACLNTHVDEDCEEFFNFCAVFEQMVSHRLRPYQKRVWHRGEGTPRHFWDVLVEIHNRTQNFLFSSCIPNIERIESIKSPKAKLRAFLRVALMEKKLSEYLFLVLDSKSLIRQCYLDGALFASEEATVLCGDLIGLNAIDFNFCLKGNENELLGPLEINYAPFLRHKQSSASQFFDEEEMLRLSGKVNDNDNSSNLLTDNSDTVKLRNLEKDFRSIKEQKDYLEELVSLRERQLAETKIRLETFKVNHVKIEKDWNQERKILDGCVLELQESMATLRTQNHQLRHQVAGLQSFKDKLDSKDIPMIDMADGPDESMYSQSADGNVQGGQSSLGAPENASRSTLPDERSIQSFKSLTSDQLRLKEDSHSMIPLTGSLADVNIALLKDQPCGNGKGKDTKSGIPSSQEVTVESIPLLTRHGALEEETVSKECGELTKDPESQIRMCAMAESYVMAEVIVEKTEMTPSSASVEGASGTVDESSNAQECVQGESVDPHDASEGQQSSSKVDTLAVVEAGKVPDVMTSSAGSAVSSGGEMKEGEALTSDPEILDCINTSSEESDAAWEMLSDSEHAEHAH